jgi:predicted permease
MRLLFKNPAFTSLAVLTLAIGMGATTTVFGWIDTVLLHPFPGAGNSQQLVALETLTPNNEPIATSYPDYQDFRDHLTSFSGIAVARHTSVSVGEPDDAERIPAQFVSGNFFDVLQVKPALGRFFASSEQGDKPRAFPLAVISYRLWQSHFNSDPGISGKVIKVNQHQLTVIGVTPPEFHGSMPGLTYDIWIPNVIRPQLNGFLMDWQLTDRHNRDLIAFARLKPGVSLEQGQAEIAALAKHMAELHPDVSEGIGATVLPMWKGHFGAQSWLLAPLQILMAACAVVLLIVCANVANLLLARFTTRQKEFSMRLALGAKRSRLFRQLLLESLVLAVLGALAGVLVAVWAGRALHQLLPPAQMHTPVLDITLNHSVLTFTALLCAVTTLLCGIVPAFHSVRMNLNDSLKESGRSGAAGQRSHRMRSLLVLSEVSLALVALVGAGLCVRSFRAAQKINPGFDPDHVLLSQFYLATNGYNLEQRKQFCYRLREKLESEPGVVSVAYSDGVPLGFEPSWWEELQIKGYLPAPGENMMTYRNVVAPGYFQLMRIPLVKGRDFTEHDDEHSQPVMIVNETFVKRYLSKGVVIGRQVHGWGDWFTIVGVVKDSKYNLLTETSLPYFYVPFRQIYRADMYLGFYLRTQGDPNQAVSTLRSAVHEIDPNVTTYDVVPLSDYIGGSLYPQKIAADFLAVLAVLALLLAALGLYSVMGYSVAQRTHEIGVRMALGAQRANVFALVLRQAMTLTVLGLLVGGIVAMVLSRQAAAIHISGSLMGGAGNLLNSGSNDSWLYIAAALFLSIVAAAASYIPAQRATKVDPLVALRHE